MPHSVSIQNHVQLRPRSPFYDVSELPRRTIPARDSTKDEFIERIALALILLVAAAAAWFHLQHASIWYDEAVTLLTTSGHSKVDWSLGLQQFQPTIHLGKILDDLYQRDVHPPLYFWALALWRVAFGASLEVARALSLLFTLVTFAILYLYAKATKTPWALVPVAIYAVSSASIRYAYDARPYAMACFLVVLTLYLAQQKSRWTGICAAACAATHYFAILCVVPLIAIESIRSWKADRRWSLVIVGSFALCASPLLILLHAHIGARPQQYPGFSSLYLESCALLKSAIAGATPKTWLSGWFLVLFLAACFALLGCWWAYKKIHSSLPFVYMLYLGGFLILAMTTNKSLVKMPTDYYLGIGAPLLALLTGFGVNVFPRAIPIFALLLLCGSLTSLPMAPTVDYRKMAQEMRSECKDCPVIAGFGYSGAIPACLLYEAKGMKVLLLRPGDTVGSVVGRTGMSETVFLVPANEPATQPLEQELIEQFPSTQKSGYFELDLAAHRRFHSSPDVRTAQLAGPTRAPTTSRLRPN